MRKSINWWTGQNLAKKHMIWKKKRIDWNKNSGEYYYNFGDYGKAFDLSSSTFIRWMKLIKYVYAGLFVAFLI
jgi:hypothetical protein